MVNRKLIYKIIGSLLLLEAGFMVLCVIMAIIYGSSEIVPFIISLLITAGAGMGLVRLGHDAPTMMTRRDSYAVVTLTWVAFSVFGSLPYMLSGIILNPTNAFFETMSGFTTTGASILDDVEQQLDSHHAILFWRSLSQWIGGLGIVFFTIAVLPSMVSGSTRVFSAEATGPIRTKMHPRLSTNAKWIWSVYLALTLGCAICYFVAGMDWFSAINYGMTTTATGGFSIHNDSLAHFQTPAIEYIGLIFQFASGINFTVLYMLIVKRQFKTFYKNSELRFYITLVAVCTVVIALLLMTHNGYGVEHAFRSSCFQVVSLMTTTGMAAYHMDYPGGTDVYRCLCRVDKRRIQKHPRLHDMQGHQERVCETPPSSGRAACESRRPCHALGHRTEPAGIFRHLHHRMYGNHRTDDGYRYRHHQLGHHLTELREQRGTAAQRTGSRHGMERHALGHEMAVCRTDAHGTSRNSQRAHPAYPFVLERQLI